MSYGRLLKGCVLDKLSVLKKAEKRGGEARRASLEHVLLTARQLGCDLRIGGGSKGGINIRYGSIGYAIMDIDVAGQVKVYVQPHPGKDAPQEMVDEFNAFIKKSEDLEPKSFPVGTYSHLEKSVEEIPTPALDAYIERSVELIRREYYQPHLDMN